MNTNTSKAYFAVKVDGLNRRLARSAARLNGLTPEQEQVYFEISALPAICDGYSLHDVGMAAVVREVGR